MFILLHFFLFLIKNIDCNLIDKEKHLTKRIRLNENVTSGTPINLSQPVLQLVRENDNNGNDSANAQPNDFCFSQPTLMEDLILCTQMNPTQSTQNPLHRLVKRMTRFTMTISIDDSLKRLTETVTQMGYSWKSTDPNLLTVSTIDRRKIQLIFKINLIEMGNQILVDFRLSRGDGIEFKRRFIQIKKLLNDVIGKEQVFW